MIHGGLADRSGEQSPVPLTVSLLHGFNQENRLFLGLLHAGDRIIEVNGFSVGGMEPEQVIHVVVKIIRNNYNKGIGLDALCLLNWIWMFLDQQARSQGTIMFKVVPITERPVHQKMMVGRPPRQLLHPLIPSSSSHLS